MDEEEGSQAPCGRAQKSTGISFLEQNKKWKFYVNINW